MVEADEKTIRQYLLGELDEAEISRFEERLMTDDELFEMLQVVEDDLLDEAAANELSAQEQARFNQHFLATPDRRARLELSRAMHARARREDSFIAKIIRLWRRPSPRMYLSFAAAAVILIAVGGWWLWFHYIPQLNVRRGLQALNNAYRNQRPTEARITGFDYAPLSVTRGNDSGKADNLDLDLAGSLLLPQVKAHPNAQSLRAAGLFYLVKRDFDHAIEYLNQALALQPNNAQLQSDLGAALLEKGKLERGKGEGGKSFESFAQSLEHLTRALELDNAPLEALFNRALCRQYMNNLQAAQEDWQRYLEKDATSKWADEARRNLKAIEEQRSRGSQTKETLYEDFLNAYRAGDDDRAWDAFSRCHVRVGNFITERLIDDYLELASQGLKEQANDRLQWLAYAGAMQNKRAGDCYTLDLSRFYKTAGFRNRIALTRARMLVKSGQAQIADSRMPQALDSYNQAERIFSHLGDHGEAGFAQYWVAICWLQINPSESLPRFRQLTRACGQNGYKFVAVRALNGLANYHLSYNDYSRAINYSSSSLDLNQAA